IHNPLKALKQYSRKVQASQPLKQVQESTLSPDPASSSSRVQKVCGVDGINKNLPSFLKVILDCKTDRLQISPDFEKHLSDWSDTAVLKTKSGKTWNVKTCQTCKGLALVDGWQEFSRDLSLENGELLVFVYNGNMQFTVRIYGPNGLERLE
ncbi:B3 domain-containing protein LOC_Os12g40080-like, partial [Diospyros lotus]|uniref:B3 domain-containing protein LOC_Os12g40080-like n=1 Tax=Diospyros lotus TaxID=55363 RepID=UPI00225C2EBE